MRYEVIWSERALNQAAGFLANDPEGLAQLFETVDLLAADPRPDGTAEYGTPDRRRLRSGRYRVLYDVNDTTVAVMRCRCRCCVLRVLRPGRRVGAASATGRHPGDPRRGQVIVDIDATLVTAPSDKEMATPMFKRGFGFAPMCAFVDHGEHGTGETLVAQLRPGKPSPWDKNDHLQTLDQALVQLPDGERGQVLVRADRRGCASSGDDLGTGAPAVLAGRFSGAGTDRHRAGPAEMAEGIHQAFLRVT